MFRRLLLAPVLTGLLSGQAGADDHFYTINTTTPLGPDILVRVNIDEPGVQVVGPLGIDVLLTGMAFNPVPVQGPDGATYPAGTLWAYDGQGGDLFTVDLDTGAAKLFGQIPGGGVTDYGLTFDLHGNLYTAFGNKVQLIDLGTLTTTTVGTLPFSDLDEWDVLEVDQEIAGIGEVPAGTFIANVGGDALDNLWLVDPSDWSGLNLGELKTTELNWTVATGAGGAIYSSGSPALNRTINRLFLDPLSAAFIIDSQQLSIYGGDVITVPPADCPADLAPPGGDGVIDVLEVLRVLAAWGAPGGIEDLNDDGIVDTLDLLVVLTAWGSCDGG